MRRVVVLGEPDEVAELALAIRHEVPAGVRLTVPRGTPLPFDAVTNWNFRAAHRAPPPQPAEDMVSWETDGKAITELLRLVSPDSSAWPGDGRARRWAAIGAAGAACPANGADVPGRPTGEGEAGPGRGVVACLADTSSRPGVGNLSAIAVHPRARRRGLGPSITAWAMRRLFAEGRDIVTLGVYADNSAGIRMYDRLGFTVDRAFTSGTLKDR